jgi:branched-chain amino acid transport system ATP-binding protein
MLELQDIHTYYGLSHVLQGISLRVERGEIVTLIGRNGAGKTTTLKSIMAITPPQRGTIRFEGDVVTGLATHQISRRGIAFVPEERRIFPNLTVYENLKLGCLRKRGRQHRRRQEPEVIDQALAYFPRLRERLRQAGGSLSGGEQQMLAMARALVSEPVLMLIDEPTEGLMPTLVRAMEEILVRMNAAGVTILLVEQNVKMALSISHRAYVIDQGRIQYAGAAQEILDDRELQRRYLTV